MFKPYKEPIVDDADLDQQDQGCLDAPVSVVSRTPRSKALETEGKDSKS